MFFTWESSTDIYTLACAEQTASGRELGSVLCEDIEGRKEAAGGRPEGGDVWTLTAASLHCMEESSTTLQSSYSPIIRKILLKYGCLTKLC